MKVIIGQNIVIYINKKLVLHEKNKIEKIIINIKEKYNIEMQGFYNVKVYHDKDYGFIIEMEKEELEYMDYFNDLEMNIEIIEDSFLYKIDDILRIKEILPKQLIRKYADKLYLEIKNIQNIELGIILENSEIIYGKEAEKIKNKSEIVNMEVIVWKNQ